MQTAGVVFADLDGTQRRGYFIQTEDCDGNAETSDGIFVYLGESVDVASLGDLIEVRGVVQEYHGQTEISASPMDLVVLSQGYKLPVAVEIDPPGERQAAQRYFESLEGMYVSMAASRVVGPTDGDQRTWVVRSDSGLEHVFQDGLESLGEVYGIGNRGSASLGADAKVGDLITSAAGAIEELEDSYMIHLLTQPDLIEGEIPPSEFTPPEYSLLNIANFNLHNLFDTADDPEIDDDVPTAAEYQRRLGKLALAIHAELGEPDLVAVQEVENDMVLRDLSLQPEIEAPYEIVWVDGPDLRGQDVALLYRKDRFVVQGYQSYQGCTELVDGLGPDGNQDVVTPQNLLTCDRDGDNVFDGNRLFSRPPLVIRLHQEGDLTDIDQPLELLVIVNHWKSKTEDTPDLAYTLPRRLEEAGFLADLAVELSRQNPGAYIIIAGDLNDYPDSQPLSILKEAGFLDLTAYIEGPGRYSHIYHGIAQVLDYILVRPAVELGAAQVEALHFNADFPAVFEDVDGTVYRGSDHDPVWASFMRFTSFVFLPAVYVWE